MKTSDRLLFFTGDIDFSFIIGKISDFEFESVYIDNAEEFSALCLKNKYDLIIYNSCGKENIEPKILKSLSGTLNLYTPVIIIADKDGKEVMNQVLKHQFDLIIFPFNPAELLVRIHSAIRRKETEVTIHNNLLDYRTLFENFPAGILQTDLHGNFIRFNRELMKILDMHVVDLSGINFFQLCHPDDYLIERQNLDRLLRKEAETVLYESRLINNDGVSIVCKIFVRASWKDESTLSSFIFSIEKIGV